MQLRFIHSALLVALLSSGCELVADFDRSKIPSDTHDSGVSTPPPDDSDGEDDGGTDAAASEDDAG